MEQKVPRIEEICTRLKDLRKQREDSPLTEEDKREKSNNYQNHLEWSTEINELEQELTGLEANKII